MAENKKSFILYADLIHTVRKMPSNKAGELFLTILEYVSDNNPVIDDPYVDLAFEPIRQQLKRDLLKYEGKRKQWSDAGKLSAESRKLKKRQQTLTTVERPLTNLTVSDSVIVSKEKKEVFNFKKSILDLGVEKQIVEDWLKVRKNKKATNSEIAFNSIKSQIEKTNLSANECIKKAVIKSWAGFEASWINSNSQQQSQWSEKKLTKIR